MNGRASARIIWFVLIFFFVPITNVSAQNEKVRIAIASISTSQVNVWVPLDAGFFKRQGLDVELVFIAGAPVGAAALMSGEVAITQGGVTASIPLYVSAELCLNHTLQSMDYSR